MKPRTQVFAFSSLCAASFVLWWRPLAVTAQLAISDQAYTHILLILPLSIALIGFNQRSRQVAHEHNVVIGSAVLVGAVMLAGFAGLGHAVTLQSGRLSLSMFAFVVWWIGSVILCFGIRPFRSHLFPLCFLFWLVPFPAFLLNRIVHFLQNQSALAARVLFLAAGIPAAQDGVVLSIPGLTMEVAQECSSIRSSLMLIIITMVLSHLFLRSWWRRVLLIAAAIPLSVAKNGLRIFVIGALGTRVDPGFLHGRLHRDGGILFLGMALIAIIALMWFLCRTEPSIALAKCVDAHHGG